MGLIGLYLIAAGLLVAAGIAKAVRPDDTARALAALIPGRRVPSQRWLRGAVRTGALAEAVLGLVALGAPRPLTAALVALSYASFALVVAYARARGGTLATCGCFGRPDTPATRVHVAVDLVLAGAAAAVAAGAPSGGSIATLLAHQPWTGVPLLFVSAVGLWLTFLALSALAALEGARRLVQPVAARGTSAP
ncbi:MAG: MauE/DoxX family redox-associated membrane protein [Acidimicrobiales bacterium]